MREMEKKAEIHRQRTNGGEKMREIKGQKGETGITAKRNIRQHKKRCEKWEVKKE